MRRGKSKGVLPLLRTLAAYPTQKSFISLGECDEKKELPFFPPGVPLSEDQREKFRGKEVVAPSRG